MATPININDYNIPIYKRIINDTLKNLSLYQLREMKLYEKSFVTNKLKELEISIKIATTTYANELLSAMKRSADAHKIEFVEKNMKSILDSMMHDWIDCATKIDGTRADGSVNTWHLAGGSPLDTVTVTFCKYIRTIDNCIERIISSIKSVDATEDMLNKATYTSAIMDDIDSWVRLNEEQEKLYRSGKDVFDKESLMLNVRKLRTFKSRVIRIFNKTFGKDSVFAPFNLHDMCK